MHAQIRFTVAFYGLLVLIAASSVNCSLIPVAAKCGPSTANITCIHRYGSLLPPSFTRGADPGIGYTGTQVPDDPSWSSLIPTANFVIFDEELGLEILGPAPAITPNFVSLLNVIHGAPVYVPELDKIFLAQYGPPGNLSILSLDLKTDPPTLDSFITDPPIYQPSGGVYHDGYIYYTAHGHNASLPKNLQQRPGIVRMDPKTHKVEWLLNNFYGFYFGGPKDLAIDPIGDIWFTDSDYALGLGLSPAPNQIQLATYRFRPATGEIQVVDTSLQHPNGIAFSRDGKTLYVTDTGLETVGKPGSESRGPGDFYNYPIRIDFTATGARNLYAWDVWRKDGEPTISAKRSIFQSLEGVPDGIKVAANGYLVVATGLSTGADVLTAEGRLIARIQTTHPVQNIVFAGEELKTLYLVGIGGMTKVDWNLKGPDPKAYYFSN